MRSAGNETAQMVLMVLLLVAGFYYLFHGVMRLNRNKRATPIVAAVTCVVYCMVAVTLFISFQLMGNISNMLLMLVLLLSLITLSIFIFYLVRHFEEVNKGALALFLVYLIVVIFMTLLIRTDADSSHDTSIRMELFDWFYKWRKTGDSALLYHFVLNIALFVPLGGLFPFIQEDDLDKLSYAIPVGLMLSTFIETAQMVLMMGQSDINDILANTLGALVGILIYKVYSFVTYGFF